MPIPPTQNRNPLWRTFRLPIVIAVISLVGLLAALLGNGALDWLSWIGLALPVAMIAWAIRTSD